MAKIVVDFGASIPGESTVTGYENKVDATGIKHNIAFTVTWDGQTRSRGSESTHGAVILTRNIDIASPKLYLACSNGNILTQGKGGGNTTVKIVVFKEGAEYLIISLRDVIVTRVRNETLTIINPKVDEKQLRAAAASLGVHSADQLSAGPGRNQTKAGDKEERLLEHVSLSYTAIHWNRGSVQGAWDLNLGSDSYAPA